jgi:transcriptional regulator with XRE-family HTH domain
VIDCRVLLSRNIKRHRTRLGITQAKLAERVNISITHMAAIETGDKHPSFRTFENIADSLGLKPYELLLGEGDIEGFSRDELTARLAENAKNQVSKAVEGVFDNITRQYKQEE